MFYIRIILPFIITLLLGLSDLLRQLSRRKERLLFTQKYLNNFRLLLESLQTSAFDDKTYEWLALNSEKIQTQLGRNGIATYQPPFAQYFVENYQIIVNTLPEIRTGKAHEHSILQIDDVLLREIGIINNGIISFKNEIKNPLLWLRIGMQNILTTPIQLLYWFGLIGKTTVSKWKNSFLIKATSAIIILLGIISSIMTIVLGWNSFMQIIRSFLN
jgi:hypothetical protein